MTDQDFENRSKPTEIQPGRPVLSHFIIEVFDLNPAVLTNMDAVAPLVDKFINRCELKVVGKVFHSFNPAGLTLLFVLAASHLAVHTWPEKGYLHIDLLGCDMEDDGGLIQSIGEIASGVFDSKSVMATPIKYRPIEAQHFD